MYLSTHLLVESTYLCLHFFQWQLDICSERCISIRKPNPECLYLHFCGSVAKRDERQRKHMASQKKEKKRFTFLEFFISLLLNEALQTRHDGLHSLLRDRPLPLLPPTPSPSNAFPRPRPEGRKPFFRGHFHAPLATFSFSRSSLGV